MNSPDLDPLIHQPVRTRVLAYLASAGPSDFTSLKTALHLSDGHMSTHMRQLVEGGYVEAQKEFVENKPKTTYKISKLGRRKFSDYVETLRELIEPR